MGRRQSVAFSAALRRGKVQSADVLRYKMAETAVIEALMQIVIRAITSSEIKLVATGAKMA